MSSNWIVKTHLILLQCRIHLDQFIGGRCRIGRQRVGGPGSGAFGDEHGNDWKILKWRIELMANGIHFLGPRVQPVDCGGGGCRRSRGGAHQ